MNLDSIILNCLGSSITMLDRRKQRKLRNTYYVTRQSNLINPSRDMSIKLITPPNQSNLINP